MYDVLVSARCAVEAERERSGILKATDGFSRDAAVKLRSRDKACTMY